MQLLLLTPTCPDELRLSPFEGERKGKLGGSSGNTLEKVCSERWYFVTVDDFDTEASQLLSANSLKIKKILNYSTKGSVFC